MGIICAISPGNLLQVTSMGVVMFLLVFFGVGRVFLCYDTTGLSRYKSLGGTLVILGDDTKSYGLSVGLVRSVSTTMMTLVVCWLA